MGSVPPLWGTAWLPTCCLFGVVSPASCGTGSWKKLQVGKDDEQGEKGEGGLWVVWVLYFFFFFDQSMHGTGSRAAGDESWEEGDGAAGVGEEWKQNRGKERAVSLE